MDYWEENLGSGVELIPGNALVLAWSNKYGYSVF
jgi:hypothetical protein